MIDLGVKRLRVYASDNEMLGLDWDTRYVGGDWYARYGLIKQECKSMEAQFD